MDFVWTEKKTNDIESNPLECWICHVKLGSSERIYRIYPQFPSDENGVVLSEEPEMYILFEEIIPIGKSFSYTHDNFVKACKTLDEAKKRAELQYNHIVNLIKIYFPNKEG